MRQVYKHCAGLDVHKKTVVACCVRIDEQGDWEQEVRTFGTMTHELLQLVDLFVTYVGFFPLTYLVQAISSRLV
ncbi:MAG: hypothetical protein ACKPA8_01090 [Dolichospermum sp.]